MEKANIVGTYAYEDGSVVHIAGNAYADKTPGQLRLIWEMVQSAAAGCINCRQILEPPESRPYGCADP
ncbi:MAG: hypothetical protein ACOYU3_09345 [Bacillota bacterium]